MMTHVYKLQRPDFHDLKTNESVVSWIMIMMEGMLQCLNAAFSYHMIMVMMSLMILLSVKLTSVNAIDQSSWGDSHSYYLCSHCHMARINSSPGNYSKSWRRLLKIPNCRLCKVFVQGRTLLNRTPWTLHGCRARQGSVVLVSAGLG